MNISQLLQQLGIGLRGLDTPSERDFFAYQKALGQEQGLQSLGPDIFPTMKALGIGQRGVDTPAERDFLLRDYMESEPRGFNTPAERDFAYQKALGKEKAERDLGLFRFMKMYGYGGR